jgi:glutamate:GABA antiporter
VYTAAVIIVLFWGGVLVSSRGLALGAELSSGGTLVGTLMPAAILVALGVAYLVQGNHPAAPMTAQHLLPPWHGLASIVLVVNSFFTYAGIDVKRVFFLLSFRRSMAKASRCGFSARRAP